MSALTLAARPSLDARRAAMLGSVYAQILAWRRERLGLRAQTAPDPDDVREDGEAEGGDDERPRQAGAHD